LRGTAGTGVGEIGGRVGAFCAGWLSAIRGGRPPMVNELFPGRVKSWLLCNNALPSKPDDRPPGTLLVERGRSMGNVVSEEGAATPRLFRQGDGAGNAVLQQKYPDPYLNF
jgi:hypothetical protein